MTRRRHPSQEQALAPIPTRCASEGAVPSPPRMPAPGPTRRPSEGAVRSEQIRKHAKHPARERLYDPTWAGTAGKGKLQ
jgi:hypothetical protein